MRRLIAAGGWLVALAAAFPTLSAAQEDVTGIVRIDRAQPEGAVVYLVAETDDVPPPQTPAVIDQKRLRFIPEVLAVRAGRSVSFKNSDPLLHNIFSPEPDEPFDLGTYPEGESREHRFERLGLHLILCNIHPEMEAYVYVTPTALHAVTDSTGRFSITGVPAGAYELHVWHRSVAPYETAMTVVAGETTSLEIDLASPDRGR